MFNFNQLIIDILLGINTYTNNLGLSIVVFTVLTRVILFPITKSSISSMQKIKDLQPEIEKLKAKYKKNPQAFQKAQLELFQKNKVNPALGCLPQLFQLVLLIVLYQALINFFNQIDTTKAMHTLKFLWFDISKPDKLYILPILTAASQLWLSWMMSLEAKTKKTKPVKNKKTNTESIAQTVNINQMQKQMLFLMPVITLFVSITLPSGLVLYWFVSSILSDFQQFFVMRKKILQRFKNET